MMWAFLLATAALGAGCTTYPTPYQAQDKKGWGYEESRLQERVIRVSFKGNRYTQETDVIDFLFLRCAELTKQRGFTHFTIQEDYGRTQVDLDRTGPRTSVGFGFGFASSRSFWGMGIGTGSPGSYSGRVNYHLAMFVIKVLSPREAKESKTRVFEADFLIESLTPKKEKSLLKKKKS